MTAPRLTRPAAVVDTTDWLKAAAIILVSIDHFGYFFMEDDLWWSVFGRLAAPTFFFLMGYARSRAVPLRWIALGVVLTLLDSWNNGWTWAAPNILLSFALIRFALPYVRALLQRRGWVAFAILVAALIAVLTPAGKVVDYGAEGWLWALFGLCQRLRVDGGSADGAGGEASRFRPMGLSAGLVAAVVYVWQEQIEFSFPRAHLVTLSLWVGVWSTGLLLFARGPSRIQPPHAVAVALRFLGRHTLEIYAIQLAGFEIIAKLMPDLVP